MKMALKHYGHPSRNFTGVKRSEIVLLNIYLLTYLNLAQIFDPSAFE